MKKYLILLMLTGLFGFTSCSDDDDNGGNNADPIVGTWIVASVQPPAINVDACEEASTITFNANNTGSATFYMEEGNCEAATTAGAWSKNGNDNYTITVPILGSLSGSVDFNGANEFFFVVTEGLAQGATITFERQ